MIKIVWRGKYRIIVVLVVAAAACGMWEWTRISKLKRVFANSAWRENIPPSSQSVVMPDGTGMWIGPGGSIENGLKIESNGAEVLFNGQGAVKGPVAIRTSEGPIYLVGEWLIEGPVSIVSEQSVWRQREGRVDGCVLSQRIPDAKRARRYSRISSCGIYTSSQMSVTNASGEWSGFEKETLHRICIFRTKYPEMFMDTQEMASSEFESRVFSGAGGVLERSLVLDWGGLRVANTKLRFDTSSPIEFDRSPENLTNASCGELLLEGGWMEHEEPFIYYHYGRFDSVVQYRRIPLAGSE